MSLQILASVVLYNPSADVILNMMSYASHVSDLLVVDNSDRSVLSEDELERNFPGVTIVRNGKNLGIAKALNQAAEFAVENGFDWILTMDQDSRFELGSLHQLISAVTAYEGNVGIFTPVHVNKDTQSTSFQSPYTIVKKTMTSGNLLSVKAYQECGGFNERLFIDYVDHEYNFRLQKNGYTILRVNGSLLRHNLGNIESYRSSFFSIKTTNHSELRRYYITRNRLYVSAKYAYDQPKFFFREIRHYWTDIFRIVVLEKNKIAKLSAVMRGTWHWITGRFGQR